MNFKIFDTEIIIDEDLIAENKEEIRRQLEEYRKGERKAFNLEISFPDDFTGEVMREMSEIDYGETKTYDEIAESLDSSAVAVGQACAKNTVPIIVPCHRVVGKDSVGGYKYGKDLKKKLLSLEK